MGETELAQLLDGREGLRRLLYTVKVFFPLYPVVVGLSQAIDDEGLP